VLHGADLTYAVVAPEDLLPAGLRPTYAAIAGGLVAGLRALGVDAERSPAGAARERLRPFDCFAAAAGDEICVAGRKLVGSAQRRAGGAVLQHGSLRLAPDAPEASRASGLGAAHATSLAELGAAIEPPTLREALVAGLASALAARFEVSDLTASERHRASVGSRQTLDREAKNTRGGSQGCPSQADT
jgi:lipoate-protein ligase A